MNAHVSSSVDGDWLQIRSRVDRPYHLSLRYFVQCNIHVFRVCSAKKAFCLLRGAQVMPTVTVAHPVESVCEVMSVCLGSYAQGSGGSRFPGAFAKLRNATVSFVRSVRPHGTTQLPLIGFL